MTKVMQGVRVVEVAHFAFAPSAGAILADWGADVIKIEPPERGDPQRAFLVFGGHPLDPTFNPIVEHINRGKRSVGVDLSKPEGREVLYEICKTADVFLTNFLPGARQKLKVDLEHIRAANPRIIYARGSAFGDKGPDRDRTGFDGTAFWSRGGIAHSISPKELDVPLALGIPAFGDSQGGMYIAGGIAAALFHRMQTGEATEVDVSLVSTAWWGGGLGLGIGLHLGELTRIGLPKPSDNPNPFWGMFKTSDGAVISLMVLQPHLYIRDVFEHLGLAELAADPRFSDIKALMANAEAATTFIIKAFASKPLDYWRGHLRTMKAQWAIVQSLLDLANDEQALANDMLFEVEAPGHDKPMKLTRGPVQFDKEPVRTCRAPRAGEHTETILREIGLADERIETLKASGTVA
jgi:crotonobetainyl-CoA:carnitine CoA-transferase CaiB-like acyl-CoA transferase